MLRPETADGKLGILDVHVQLENGTQMDMEMQVEYFQYWDKRVLFYLGRMYTGQLKRGEAYEELKKCIHVSILDFVCFPDDEECCRTIHLRDDKTGQVYSDMLEIQILELKKLPAEAKNSDDIINWMRFFGGKSREDAARRLMEEFRITEEEARKYLDEYWD